MRPDPLVIPVTVTVSFTAADGTLQSIGGRIPDALRERIAAGFRTGYSISPGGAAAGADGEPGPGTPAGNRAPAASPGTVARLVARQHPGPAGEPADRHPVTASRPGPRCGVCHGAGSLSFTVADYDFTAPCPRCQPRS